MVRAEALAVVVVVVRLLEGAQVDVAVGQERLPFLRSPSEGEGDRLVRRVEPVLRFTESALVPVGARLPLLIVRAYASNSAGDENRSSLRRLRPTKVPL